MPLTETMIEKPLPQHLHVLAQLKEKIETDLRRLPQRGLLVVQLFEGSSDYRMGFTPRRLADVPHVMAMGLPEEIAVSILEIVRTYDMDREAAVLVTDRRRTGEVAYSFIRLEVKVGLPTFQLGSGTLH